jgi:hypothetical protein
MFTIEWYYLLLFAVVLIIAILIAYAAGRNSHVSESSSIVTPSSQEHPAPVEEKAKEEDEEDQGTIHIIKKDGKSLIIRCDSLDSYEFQGGSLSLEWDDCGEVTITDGDSAVKSESYDTDEERLFLLYDDVSRVIMTNL